MSDGRGRLTGSSGADLLALQAAASVAWPTISIRLLALARSAHPSMLLQRNVFFSVSSRRAAVGKASSVTPRQSRREIAIVSQHEAARRLKSQLREVARQNEAQNREADRRLICAFPNAASSRAFSPATAMNRESTRPAVLAQ